jgi:hypothetical protein
VPAWTVRFTPPPDDVESDAVGAACARSGARLRWERPQFERRYALVESTDEAVRAALSAVARATVFAGPVIALAVSPTAPEALPRLQDALCGAGRPAGILGCERTGGAVIVEWNLDRTPYETIETLIDVECGVYRCGRVNSLLTPLPIAWLTRIAAHGLHAPEIVPERVLEVQLEMHGIDA